MGTLPKVPYRPIFFHIKFAISNPLHYLGSGLHLTSFFYTFSSEPITKMDNNNENFTAVMPIANLKYVVL